MRRVVTVAARLGRSPVTREGIVRRALEMEGEFKLKPQWNTVVKCKCRWQWVQLLVEA